MIQSAIWNFGLLLHTTWLIVVIDQKSVVKSLLSQQERPEPTDGQNHYRKCT